jgi:hypothetical protein
VATSSAASGNSPPVSNSPVISTPAGNGLGNGLQPGGSSDGVHHHHSDGFPGVGGAAGNSTTSTTSTGTIYSIDE